MGYAKASQKTNGIHLRLFSRAFAIADKNDQKNSVVFVSVDAAMVSTIVRTKVSNTYSGACIILYSSDIYSLIDIIYLYHTGSSESS